MKYYLLAGIVVLAGIVAVVLSKSSSVNTAEMEHFAKKRDIAEAETKVRPAHFEDMKWKPGVEMRAPASNEKK